MSQPDVPNFTVRRVAVPRVVVNGVEGAAFVDGVTREALIGDVVGTDNSPCRDRLAELAFRAGVQAATMFLTSLASSHQVVAQESGRLKTHFSGCFVVGLLYPPYLDPQWTRAAEKVPAFSLRR